MQFERKKQLFAFGALVFGLALAGCSGDGGAEVTNFPVISVDSSLGLGSGVVADTSGAGQDVSLTDGSTGFRPAGTTTPGAGTTVGTIESLTNILPGLSSDAANRPILLSRRDGEQTEAPVPSTLTGLYLQTDGSITTALLGGSGASRATSPKIVMPDGDYKVRINGPLFIRNAGNVLTISTYFQLEFSVSAGTIGLPNRISGTLPANGSPGHGLSLATSEFMGTGGTTSLSLRGTNANRDQDRTINHGGSATFAFSDSSDFVVPAAGLNRVVYRANRGFEGNQD